MNKHPNCFSAEKHAHPHALESERRSTHQIAKWLFLLSLLFLGFNATSGPAAPGPYHATIFLPANQSGLPNLPLAASDMARWMSVATGDSFIVKTADVPNTNGIQLQWVGQASLPDSIKTQLQKDGQSFFIIADGTHSALIIGTGEISFINGIYTFLNELGFRWYMPGDAWAKVPKINKTNLSIRKLYRPSFQNRTYFGTGSSAGLPRLDPTNTFQQDFDNWNKRNRYTSDFRASGHLGQAFYEQNKPVLNAHPEYSCGGTVSQLGRIDITKPNAVNLFVDWTIRGIDTTARFQTTGAEPADGSGGVDDCLPTGMAGISTWSDKYFWLANKVAEKAAVKAPKAMVQIYAYASHAEPPSFPLHQKVYPVIVPYAFQSVTAPELFIQMWQQKISGRPMGMRDYWNITQWSVCRPGFNLYEIPKRLTLWKQSNVTLVNIESTLAKGPMGHALWIAGQMMWNVNSSFDSLYNEFLTDCFGPAATDVRRMYDRWSLNYQEDMEWAFSVRDLQAASTKTTDTAIQKRLTELKAYVHYLKFGYEYQNQPDAVNYQKLIKYILSIHHLRMVQTYALLKSYITPPAGATPTAVLNALTGMEAAAVPLNKAGIDANFAADLAASPTLYTLSNFQFDIKKAMAPPGATAYQPGSMNGGNTYYFYLPVARTVTFQAGATDVTRFLLQDSMETVIKDLVIPSSATGYQSISATLPAGTYHVSFGGLYRFSRLKFPEGIAFFTNGRAYDNYQYPLQYVYVPNDVSEIVYQDASGPVPGGRGNWYAPDGTVRNPTLIKDGIYKVPVAPSERGRVWVLNIGHARYKLLNIPNVYSLNKFNYVP